ncbi:MAG: ImmA/IrrE family metallo-endopeptidase [Actinobacteria bacterium]|nr:ImmA/IrrE family metallo-endopeptidase [Actinomycetota bacterium]
MTTWVEANTRAAVRAAELHADLEIDLSRPVDVFGAVEQLGLVLAFGPLGDASGVYLPGSKSAGIMLHEGHPRTRQRYTAAHELGHHIFEHAAEIDLAPDQGLERAAGERWPDHEKEAEAFAAWFLMPRRLLRSGLRRLGIERPADAYDIYALSLWLGASYTATARQLAVTKLIDQGEADVWAKIPPRNLKLALAGEMAPDDLRNDVWWLDRRNNMQPVDARPGDRLVLSLPEIPSSGFTWKISTTPDSMRMLADSYDDRWEPDRALHHAAHPHDPESAGAGPDRYFVFEIDPDAEKAIQPLVLVKGQPWEDTRDDETYELLISVNTPLHGVQVPESALAIRGGEGRLR